MEARAREAGSRTQSHSGHDNVTVLNCRYRYMDDNNNARCMGSGQLQRPRSWYKSLFRSKGTPMITNIACYVIIASCAILQFLMGAYMHVTTNMVLEYRYILSLSVNQLTMVDVTRGVS